MHPVEKRIRNPSDNEVYECVLEAFSEQTDIEIIAELMRMVVFIAVCYNGVIEDDKNPYEVLQRHIFAECDELAEYFPWPLE